MRLEGSNLLDHGPINVDAIRALLPTTEHEFWQSTAKNREVLAGKRSGTSVVLQTWTPQFKPLGYEVIRRLIDRDEEFHVFQDQQHQDVWDVLEDCIFPSIRRLYPGGEIAVVQLTVLPAGEQIGSHVDTEIWSEMHRLHVPLETSSQVTFTIGDEGSNYVLEQGKLYELDNTKVHSVVNGSEQDRIHLMIDVLPRAVAKVKVHETDAAFVSAMSTKPVRLGLSMLCRAAPENQTHGRFLIIDPTTLNCEFSMVLDTSVQPDNPRGGGRGFRGNVQDPVSKKIFVADYAGITVLSGEMERLMRIVHPAMMHIHALAVEDGYVWAVSTANDTILSFSTEDGSFAGAWEFGSSVDGKVEASWTKGPSRSVAAVGHSRFHLNALWFHEGSLLTGGLRSNGIISLSQKGDADLIHGPAGAHDFLVVDGKLVLLDTEATCVRVLTLEGAEIMSATLPEHLYGGSNQQCHPSISRPGFLRGISLLAGPYVYVGFAPAGVARFDTRYGHFDQAFKLSDDVRWMVAGLSLIEMELEV